MLIFGFFFFFFASGTGNRINGQIQLVDLTRDQSNEPSAVWLVRCRKWEKKKPTQYLSLVSL